MRRVRLSTLPLAAVAVAVVLAGCSSSSNQHGSTSPLHEVLDHVAANDNTRAWVEYGRPKAALAANGGSLSRAPYGGLIGYGASSLATYSKLLPPVVGFDPTKADAAVLVGQPPTHAGWLIGLDTGQVEPALTKLGAEKEGSALRLAPDNQFDLDGPLSQKLKVPLTLLNLVSPNGTSLRYGSSTAALDLIGTSKGDTLGADKTVAAVADCLGNPLAAVLTDQPGGKSGQKREVGIAVTGTSGTDATEQLCVAAGSNDDAQALKSRLQEQLTSGQSQQTRQPWSELLTGASIEVLAGNIVRATAHPAQDSPATVLFRALTNHDLATLIGD